jgi:hypothetical protein
MMMDEQRCLVVKHTFLELGGADNSTARKRSWSDSDLLDVCGAEEKSLEIKESKDYGVDADSDGSTTDADTAPETSSSDESGDKSSIASDTEPMHTGFSTVPQLAVPPCLVAGTGNMMYMVQMAPNGTQMLCPMQPPGMFAQPTATLEQQAMSLDAYATQLAVEARRAKAAASAASRKNIAGSWSEMNNHCRKASFGSQSDLFPNDKEEVENDDRTTLMFRNLPNNYTRAALLDMLDAEGFNRVYSFVYLPTDFKNFPGFGYAFVNFATHESAVRAKRHFQGYCKWSVPSQKVCEVVWSGPVQGLSNHTERYRNSPVMHDSVPDEYKPVVFVDGKRVKFPAPTKKIRPPRVRHGIAEQTQV